MNVVIIGGTSGIGLGTAHYLAKEGHKVCVGGRRQLKESEVRSLQVDVTDENSVKNFFNKVSDIDALIFCSGITEPKFKIEDFDLSSHEKIFRTNVSGFLLCLKYAYPLLRKSKGNVVAVGSIAARSYSTFSSVNYTASKYALSGVVSQLAIDFAKDGVRINAIHPSMTLTPMLEENLTPLDIARISEKTPLGRTAIVDDVAKGIDFLISNHSSFVTGTGLDINGGLFING